MENTNKKADGFPAEEILTWWWEMQPASEHQDQPNRRGELAALRRCKTLAEVLLVPRFQTLRWKLQAAGYNHIPACAAIAGILAHVKTDDTKQAFAEWLAKPKAEGSGPRLSELRFRRLVRVKSHDELFADLIRILPLAADTAPVKALARDIYLWNDQTRRNWVFKYYDTLAGGEEYPE
ncbi:type I-E CRISPR-associated protein Cse2/CasB [Methylocaldum gracile]|jgi:CRISPR system Cascade subunit CasB|nr:type I-E CRISPR-associated protein Cse2/CasB [Methylocaldum sp. BRCS4]